MKREGKMHLNDLVFRSKEDIEVMEDLHADGNYAEFKQLIVHGNCIAKETIRAEKLVVDGNLEAKNVIACELYVSGNVNVSKLTICDAEINGNLIADFLQTNYGCVTVGGKVKIKFVSGCIVALFVG